MANATRTIDLIFQGVDKTGAATLSAIGNAEKFAGKLQNVTEPIADFTLGMAKFEGAILAGGAALVAFSVREASQFQSAALDLQKVLEDSDGPIERYAQAASDLALQFGISSTDVLASIANFKQAGFTAVEATDLARESLKLKVAGDLDAAQASELLVASLKGFGLEASASTKVVDLLNEVSNRYATNVQELGEGFARLSPVAKAAGLSLEETAGILTPGIEVFRSGSEVANGLRTVLLRLTDDAKPVQEALGSLGVTQNDANGKLKSARDLYFEVAAAFKVLDPSQRTFVAQQLAGTEQAAKFLASMDGLNKTLAISSKEFEFSGSAQKEVAVRLQSLEVQAGRTKESFSALLRSIGAPLLDEFTDIAGALTKIFQALAANVQEGGLGKLVKFIESIFDDVLVTLEEVAKNLPAALAKADFSGFENGIRAVYEAFGVLFANIDLRTVDGLTAAIELAGTAFLGLSKFTGGVIESFKPLLDLLIDVGSGVRGANVEWLKSVGAIGGAVVQFNLLLDAFGGLAPVLTTIVGLFVANQAVSLVGALKVLASVLPVTSSAMLSLSAATGALAGTLAVAEIVKLVDALLKWKDATDKLKESQAQSKDIQSQAADAVAQFVERTGLAVASLDEINELINSGVVVWDDATKQYVKAADAQASLGRETDTANKAIGASNQKLIDAAEAAAPAAWNAQRLADANKDLAGKVQGAIPIIDAATGKVVGYEQGLVKASEGALKLKSASEGVTPPLKTSADALEKLGKKSDLTNKELIELQKNLKDAEVELAKIASNERIKNIEFKVQLQVADIEAQTKRIERAFASIDSTVNSTADVLNSLFGLFGKGLSFQEMFDVRDQIDQENRRRDDALALQKKLTEAQIEQMKAQTQALLRGDAMIKVDGAGLQPHLEAFMWEILRTIQIRVNRDGLGMLLGT